MASQPGKGKTETGVKKLLLLKLQIVNEKKIHKNFVKGIDIPSADYAWQKMHRKLLEDDKEKPAAARWFYRAGIVLLLVIAASWFFRGYFTKQKDSAKNIIESVGAPIATIEIKDKYSKEKTKVEKSKTTDTVGVSGNLFNRSVAYAGKKVVNNVGNEKRKILRQKKAHRMERESVATARKKPDPVSKSVNDLVNDSTFKNDIAIERSAADSVARNVGINDTKEKENEAPENDKSDLEGGVFVEGGAQWNLQVPVAGSTGYFSGTRATSQPYRLLLPALWLSIQAEKIRLTVEFNPFASSVLADKPYASENTFNGTGPVVEHRTLHKIFGLSTGIAIDYNIKERWWLGGNVKANFWRSGTATVTAEKTNTNGTRSVIYTNSYRVSDSAWASLEKFQFGIGFQTFYRLPKWQAGLRFNYYLDAITEAPGQKNKTMLQFFVRRQLYRNKK